MTFLPFYQCNVLSYRTEYASIAAQLMGLSVLCERIHLTNMSYTNLGTLQSVGTMDSELILSLI